MVEQLNIQSYILNSCVVLDDRNESKMIVNKNLLLREALKLVFQRCLTTDDYQNLKKMKPKPKEKNWNPK